MNGQMEIHDYGLREARIVLKDGSRLYGLNPLNSPSSAIEIMKTFLSEKDREYLTVVNLDTKLCPISFNIVAVGGINYAPVSIGNVFKTSILSNAASILIFHNHPSGDPSPSQADIDMTNKTVQAGFLLDIPVQDHIIVGTQNQYFSFVENGIFPVCATDRSIYETVSENRTVLNDAISSIRKTDAPKKTRRHGKFR